MNTFKNFYADFGLTIATVESAEIQFNYIDEENLFGDLNSIINTFMTAYRNAGRKNLYKLFGSLE